MIILEKEERTDDLLWIIMGYSAWASAKQNGQNTEKTMQKDTPQPEDNHPEMLVHLPARRRKIRRDKNTVQATDRDLSKLVWVADQYAVRLDHLRRILSQEPGAPMHGTQLALSTLKDQVERWRRAGWVEYGRYLANQPAWVWATRRGLRAVGLDRLYEVKEPAESRYKHIWAINMVRLRYWEGEESAGAEWISERRLLAEQIGSKKQQGDVPLSAVRIGAHGAIPDAVVCDAEGEWTDAIEVQLSVLKPVLLARKILKVLSTTYMETDTGEEYVYNRVHFYVPTQSMKAQIERMRAKLSEDDQERLRVTVSDLSYKWTGWPPAPGSAPAS
jgi:hypothetical protein